LFGCHVFEVVQSVGKGVHLGCKVGVDGLELGGRLPAREGRARPVVEEQRHFHLELAHAKPSAGAPRRLARIVSADDFQEGMEDVSLEGGVTTWMCWGAIVRMCVSMGDDLIT
jgi:hypothetical protein